MYFVYVLKSINYKKSYVGHTDDLLRRITEHNNGQSKFTSKFKPWKIIYNEKFESEVDAIFREKYYKSHAGRKKLKELFNNCGIV
jgi:putative endonuclease